MSDPAEMLTELTQVAAEAERLRAQAGESLRQAVRQAADSGLTQQQIAHAIGRSQPEVSRLIKTHRA